MNLERRKSGIDLKNFRHCTKQRKLQFLGQKCVAIGWVRSLVDGDCMERKVFHAHESIIIFINCLNTITGLCRSCAI